MAEKATLLVGGPMDQTRIDLDEDTVAYEVRTEGTLHRYIRTTTRRELEGSELTVFTYDGQTYDGAVSP